VSPFHISYTLTRRQRLRVEVVPWLPALAGTVGFGVGALYLAASVSSWCVLLLGLPVAMYRGLFAFALDLTFRGARPVDLHVDDPEMEVRTDGAVKQLALTGIFQVFRSGDVWTVLHLDGTVLTIPADAITGEQVGYLRSFAHRAAAARAEAQG
jgi:hypothetical protein